MLTNQTESKKEICLRNFISFSSLKDENQEIDVKLSII
jgi:hypothetical protein